jgi:hypothetical protein
MKTIILSTLSLVILLSSCVIQKRVHRNGFYFDMNKSYSKSKEVSENVKSQPEKYFTVKSDLKSTTSFNDTNSVVTKLDETMYNEFDIKKIINPEKKDVIIEAEACDMIIMKSGEEISSKVREINENDIKYSKCDNPQGVMYTISKKEVLMIKYANGSKDVFNESEANKTEKKSELNSDLPIHPLAIVGFVLAFLFPFIGAILCAVAVKQIDKNPTKYRGRKLALAGSVIALILSIIILVVILI